MIFKIYNYKTRQEVIDYISELPLNKIHHIKITQKREKRSIDQNSLMWLWLSAVEQETGNNKEDLHDYFRAQYLGGEWREIFNDKYFKLKSTTQLNTLQFTNYLNKIQVFANTELSIQLPNPEDLKFEQFKSYYSKFL